jgi:hypothetical protein
MWTAGLLITFHLHGLTFCMEALLIEQRLVPEY